MNTTIALERKIRVSAGSGRLRRISILRGLTLAATMVALAACSGDKATGPDATSNQPPGEGGSGSSRALTASELTSFLGAWYGFFNPGDAEFDFSTQTGSVRCTEGGSIMITVGEAPGSIKMKPAACQLADQDGNTWTFTGDPDITFTVTSTGDPNNQNVFEVRVTQTGAVKAVSDSYSGRCVLDLTLFYRMDMSTGTGSATISGTLNGAPVQKTLQIGQ